MKEEKFRIGKEILTETDCQFEIVVDGDTFVMKVPQPKNFAAINARTVYYTGGAEMASITADSYIKAVASATIFVLLLKAPDWWKGVDECYDVDLIVEIYSIFTEKYEAFKERLKKNRR